MNKIKLVATDLDGTFLKDDHTISKANIEALEILGEKNIIRVAATGRSLHKVKQVIATDVPFDYIVYSSGAGVFNWRTKSTIHTQNISVNGSQKILDYLIQKRLNFHAFYPAPENHKHWYYRGEKPCEEFERYFEFNKGFATPLPPNGKHNKQVCQFLIFIEENTPVFEQIKSEIEKQSPEIRVIRSSSPITKGYIWIEIFHHSVSKGNGVKLICDDLNVDYKSTLGIGNDYNDFDLLDFTLHSFLTENSPAEIKHKYPLLPSNENDAFARAIKNHIN